MQACLEIRRFTRKEDTSGFSFLNIYLNNANKAKNVFMNKGLAEKKVYLPEKIQISCKLTTKVLRAFGQSEVCPDSGCLVDEPKMVCFLFKN